MPISEPRHFEPPPLYPVPGNQLQYIQDWLGQNPPSGRLDTVASILLALANNDTLIQFVDLINIGSGDPNAVVTASPPAIYLNTAGGAATTLYVKESGTDTNTGWVGK